MEWIVENAGWFWLIAGISLLVGEMLIPGIYLLWLGLAAIVTAGFVALFGDVSFLFQAIVFTGLCTALIVGARKYLKKHPLKSDQEKLSRAAISILARSMRWSRASKTALVA